MKLYKSVILFLAVFIFSASFILAQDEMQKNDSQDAWQEYMTPGWGQEMLAKAAGNWKTESTIWMEPGAELMVTQGDAKGEMILGGRYLQIKHSGNMMGMQFEGISIGAYDNAMEEFISHWIDNFGTGIMTSKGSYEEETNTITYWGEYADPMTKEYKEFRQTWTFDDKDRMTLKMYMVDGEEEFQSMEVAYSRAME
jgi:hypothetical protein